MLMTGYCKELTQSGLLQGDCYNLLVGPSGGMNHGVGLFVTESARARSYYSS